MKKNITTLWATFLCGILAILIWAGNSLGQGYTLSDLQYLPGDAAAQTAVRLQDNSRIAPGGPGYLVVWEDERTVLASYLTYPNYPLMGNLRDLYAARLDSNGNLLDENPIIIAAASLNQSQPDVAWNGQNWLVVWVTQRADWYFFQDIVGVRISPEGVVLDSTPINIRLENGSPANDHGSNPSVTSDGTNWVVVWEDQSWQGSYSYPTAVGARIAPNGTILDDPPPVLYQGTTPGTFGPIDPQMRWAGDEFLLVWEHSGYYQILGKRFTAALQPIDALPFQINSTSASWPRLATNGVDFFVVSREQNGYRVTHDGHVLDPGGISFGVVGAFDRGPDVTWEGTNWVAGYNGPGSASANMYLTRIATNGTLVPPSPTRIQFTADDQYNASVSSRGNGSVQVAWEQRDANLQQGENMRSARVDADWSVTPAQDISLGWHRQINARFATNGSEHLIVYQSQGGGLNRICAQRIDDAGSPLDLEPTVLTTTPEGYTAISTSAPDVASNGSVYMVVWSYNGSVYGRRLQLDGTPIEPAAVNLLTDAAGSPAVGALGNNFYLVYTYTFSGDQVYLKGVRIDGSTMTLMGTPTIVNNGSTTFALNPVVRSFSDRWFVAWEAQVTHDNVISTIRGFFVTSDGVAGGNFAISTSADADNPDVAIGNNRAFIVWNEYTTQDGRIRARLMNQDGSFVAGQFLVNDALNRQFYPTAAWDGNQFATAWVDFRSLTGVVDQLRGDIYAARVGFSGTVLDPDGLQLTSGPLPEDLPAAAGADGKTVFIFSKLNGAVNPEIQRLGYRTLENTVGGGVDITMTPVNPPIQIPASGGSFSFNVSLQNLSAVPQTFDGWIMQILPDNTWQGPLLEPISLTLPPGFTLQRQRSQNVPGSALPGSYTYIGYVGLYSTVKWDSSFFNYTKLASGNGTPVGNWANWGDSFDPWTSPPVTALPTEFAVSGPYPNPFNPATTLGFALPQAARVNLSIYDASGRLVATLADGWREAGTHQVTFDGSNLASGVYIYRLQAGSFAASGKMVLMK